jgi:hypothetical protein
MNHPNFPSANNIYPINAVSRNMMIRRELEEALGRLYQKLIRRILYVYHVSLDIYLKKNKKIKTKQNIHGYEIKYKEYKLVNSLIFLLSFPIRSSFSADPSISRNYLALT